MSETQAAAVATEQPKRKGGWGGKRAGSGRKKRGYSARAKTLLLNFAQQKDDIPEVMPLDVLLACMRAAYRTAIKHQDRANAAMLELAARWAKDAAPYCHVKLISHEVSGKGGSALQFQMNGRVEYFVPDNGRRVAPLPPANDAALAAVAAAAQPGATA